MSNMQHRNILRIFWIVLLTCLAWVSPTQAQTAEPREVRSLALSELGKGIPSSSNPKIVVFLPSLTEETEYASMLVQAFKNYFVDKLAFRPEDRKSADVDIILLTQSPSPAPALDSRPAQASDPQRLAIDALFRPRGASFYFDTRGMQVLAGIPEALRQSLELPALTGKNDDAVLLLLDGSKRIVARDDHYRAQGEHLKPLEYRVKKLLKLPTPEATRTSGQIPAVGQPAPNIPLSDGKRVADYRSQILVLSFYPAAFSGVLDIPKLEQAHQEIQRAAMSCIGQIRSLNQLNLNAKVFALSESTPELLERWQDILLTRDIQYVNDPGYASARAYGAYDEKLGYNKRVTAVIDQQGLIAYLNPDYHLDQEARIRKVVEKLSASSQGLRSSK